MARKPKVDARTALARAVEKLRARAKSQMKMAGTSGVPQTTVSRVMRGSSAAIPVNPTIRTIETLAVAYSFEAWQLLVPGFDPDNPPALAGGPPYSRRVAEIAEILQLVPETKLDAVEQMARALLPDDVPPQPPAPDKKGGRKDGQGTGKLDS